MDDIDDAMPSGSGHADCTRLRLAPMGEVKKKLASLMTNFRNSHSE